ncbi:hypothetical protein NDU88_007301 [Pleurodeles waltl]|uniref:Uncharacterized protein n=1 Tax=Pleurodeles waltl TaxID=8319 RepID=A0AAV7UNF7_PLEWA|nr:hypothetical protein NDU88_007301 [Pleurodeles waltl]
MTRAAGDPGIKGGRAVQCSRDIGRFPCDRLEGQSPAVDPMGNIACGDRGRGQAWRQGRRGRVVWPEGASCSPGAARWAPAGDPPRKDKRMLTLVIHRTRTYIHIHDGP